MLRGSRRFLFDGTWLPVKALCDIGVAHLVTPYSLIGLAEHDPLNQFGFAYLEIDCDAQMAQEALEYLNLSWDKPLVDLEAELSERFPNNSIWTKGMTHYSMRLVERHGYLSKRIDLGLLEHLRQKFRHLEDGAGTEPVAEKQSSRSALDALTRILDPDHPDTIATIAVLTRLYWDKRKPNGPEEEVLNAVFSPDCTRVLTESWDDTARVWNASTGAELNVLRVHESFVMRAVFSPDCTRVLTESYCGPARVWDASTGAELNVLRGHEDRINNTVFSQDGTRVLTASVDMTARVWDASTGAELNVLRGHKYRVTHGAFSPDGARVLTTSKDETVRIWDASTGAELNVLRGYKYRVTHAAFSPDGTRVLTVSWTNIFDGTETARLWDTSTGAELACLPITDRFLRAVSYPEFFELVTSRGQSFYRWVDGTQISDGDPPLECPARPTLISKDGATGLSLRVRGLPAFAPPVLHLGTTFTSQVNPTDPLSFVAGCADGSVRFFHLEGVDLPTTH